MNNALSWLVMAGEIQEPFRLSFQLDSLHSGSISFGRFESESLCWERRSSFSHNRYLEEAEKHSKPGSVIEKKAYFEAHFKRKALQKQNSFECQNGSEYQTSENELSENMYNALQNQSSSECQNGSEYQTSENDLSENVYNAHQNQSSFECQNGLEYQTSENDSSENVDYGQGSEHISEASDIANFGHSLVGSEYDEEFVTIKCERVSTEISQRDSQVEFALSNVDNAVNNVSESVKPMEANQTETRDLLSVNAEPVTEMTVNLLLVNSEPEKKMTVNSNNSARNVDVISRAVDHYSNGVGKDDWANSKRGQNLSAEVAAPLEVKPMKLELKSHNVTLDQRNESSKAYEESIKKVSTKDTGGSLRTSAERQSSCTVAPTTHLIIHTSKPESSGNSGTNENNVNKSSSRRELGPRNVEPQHSVMEKVVSRTHQTGNRARQINSTKSGLKHNAPIFNFRSDERAERRKEFYRKLEEKMHAKEAEMNQIQAKTLESNEAEIKQFRRSLNFKASPMPSFYQETVKRGSDKNKAVFSSTKARKLKSKSLSSSSNSKQAETLSGSLHVNITDPLQTSGETNCFATVTSETSEISLNRSPGKSHSLQSRMSTKIIGKKEREKKDANFQKHLVPEVTKGQKVMGKPKVGSESNGNRIMKKGVKNVVGSASGTDHLAVGVAY